MELSDDVRKGLSTLANGKVVQPAQFGAVVKLTAQALLSGQQHVAEAMQSNKALEAMDKRVLKHVHASVATLLLESSRLLIDEDLFASTLSELGFGPKQSELMGSVYKESRDGLRKELAKTSFQFPHIVDVDWRMDYHIKSAKVERVDEFTWSVTLKTMDKGALKDVTFACNREEMQELLLKLKDALGAIERLTSE